MSIFTVRHSRKEKLSLPSKYLKLKELMVPFGATVCVVWNKTLRDK